MINQGGAPFPCCTPLLQGLGYGILAGSTLVKVPQLLNVLRAKSAEGLNPLSFELETVGLLIATTYGFLMQLPFSAFGEVVVSADWPPSSSPASCSWALCPQGFSAEAKGSRSCERYAAATVLRRYCQPLLHITLFPLHLQALLVQNNLLLLLVYRYQRRSLARTFTFLALLATWATGVLHAPAPLYVPKLYTLACSLFGVATANAPICALVMMWQPGNHTDLPLPPLRSGVWRDDHPRPDRRPVRREQPAAGGGACAPDPAELHQSQHRAAEPDHVRAQRSGRGGAHLHVHPGGRGRGHDPRRRTE